MRVAVVGGTGVVGRHTVEALRAAGHEAVVIARSAGVDVASGRGLDAALAGAKAVIDVGNIATVRRSAAEAFFDKATRNLLDAGAKAGVEHLVVLSIVGCDRVDLGYYFGKRRQEELVLAGPLPFTILRATQFHEFPGQLIDRTPPVPVPVNVVPRMRSQPIAAREVGTALARIVGEAPAGRAPDLAGPEVHEMPDLVRMVMRARGSRKAVIGVRLPGATGKALAHGGLLPDAEGPRGRETFAEWLAAQPAVD
ncbi:MAG TPA: NAD(P)H-binding protein [Mycobacteriales bacterium]|nr:NAD(P)H-binding protein [Mycobacteriales bacterium]